MENQVNIGDQNTQQIGQNPISQPSLAPDKPKTNFLMIGGVVLACFIVFGFGGYYLGKQSSISPVTTNNKQIQAIPTMTSELSNPTPTLSPSSTPISVNIPGWKNYTISSLSLSLQYPPNLEILTDINDSTALAADKEYLVFASGTDVIYLEMFLYKSNKTPSDWWDTEGKNKFEKLAVEIENAMTPKVSVNLTYSTKLATFAGKQALEVVVTSDSDYESFNNPKQRYLTIFQQNGYVVMLSYSDQGTTAPSITTSKQILSTFKFAN